MASESIIMEDVYHPKDIVEKIATNLKRMVYVLNDAYEKMRFCCGGNRCMYCLFPDIMLKLRSITIRTIRPIEKWFYSFDTKRWDIVERKKGCCSITCLLLWSLFNLFVLLYIFYSIVLIFLFTFVLSSLSTSVVLSIVRWWSTTILCLWCSRLHSSV